MRKNIQLLFLAFLTTVSAAAQERTWDPATMVQREKQAVFDSIPDLSDDQKAVIEEIYVAYQDDVSTLMQSANGDREKMRAGFMELRENKNTLLKEILTEEQWTVYDRMTSRRRGRRPPNE